MNKAIFIFSLLLLGTCSHAAAQKLLAITYKHYQVERLDTSLNKDQQKVPTEKFIQFIGSVSNDTANLVFYSENRDEIPKKYYKKLMGKKLLHHAAYNDFNSNLSWNEVNFPEYSQYLVSFPFLTSSWKLFDVSKIILGHNCKMAMNVSAKNDSTIVWYTNDLPGYKAKLNFYNAPGVVLAAETQTHYDLMKYEALDLFEYEATLMFPKRGKKISQEEFKNLTGINITPGGRIFKTRRSTQ